MLIEYMAAEINPVCSLIVPFQSLSAITGTRGKIRTVVKQRRYVSIPGDHSMMISLMRFTRSPIAMTPRTHLVRFNLAKSRAQVKPVSRRRQINPEAASRCWVTGLPAVPAWRAGTGQSRRCSRHADMPA